jgi:ribosomal protein S18 acetylase RimI-like enzyme
VTHTRVATKAEEQAWSDRWRERLLSWYGRDNVPAEWARRQAENRIAILHRAPQRETLALTSADGPVGRLAVSLVEQGGAPAAFIADIWIDPEHRRQGHGARALRLAEAWARAHQARSVQLMTDPEDPAHAALFARYPVRALEMIKPLTRRDELPAGLTGRTMTEDEFAGWRDETERGYAADIAGSGAMSPEDATARSIAQMRQLLPDGLQTAGHSFLTLCADGEAVATNWIEHRPSTGVSWVYGVETHEQFRGKGYGRAAMVLGEQATLDAGDTHLALNVFGQNGVAISLYRSMGYRAYDDGRSIDL